MTTTSVSPKYIKIWEILLKFLSHILNFTLIFCCLKFHNCFKVQIKYNIKLFVFIEVISVVFRFAFCICSSMFASYILRIFLIMKNLLCTWGENVASVKNLTWKEKDIRKGSVDKNYWATNVEGREVKVRTLWVHVVPGWEGTDQTIMTYYLEELAVLVRYVSWVCRTVSTLCDLLMPTVCSIHTMLVLLPYSVLCICMPPIKSL